MSWYNGNDSGFIDATQVSLQQNVDLTSIQSQITENTNTIIQHTNTLFAHNIDLDNLFSTFQFRVLNTATNAFETRITSDFDIIFLRTGTTPKLKIVNGLLYVFYESIFGNLPVIGEGFIEVSEYITNNRSQILALDLAFVTLATQINAPGVGIAPRLSILEPFVAANVAAIADIQIELFLLRGNDQWRSYEISNFTEIFRSNFASEMVSIRAQIGASAENFIAIVEASSQAGVGIGSRVAQGLFRNKTVYMVEYFNYLTQGFVVVVAAVGLAKLIYDTLTDATLNDSETKLLLMYEKIKNNANANIKNHIHKEGLVIDQSTNNNLGAPTFYIINLSNTGKLKIRVLFENLVKTAIIEEVLEVGNPTFTVGSVISISKSLLGGIAGGNLLINVTSLKSDVEIILDDLLKIQDLKAGIKNRDRLRNEIPNRSEFGNTFNIINTSSITNEDTGEVLNIPTINVNIATTSSVGLVQVGTGLNVNSGVISVNSATTSKWTSDGLGGISFIGNVGIGTIPNPFKRLDVTNTSGNCSMRLLAGDGFNIIYSLRELNDNNGFDIINDGIDHNFKINAFNNSATPRIDFIITRDTGNIGIGNTNPTAKLDITTTSGNCRTRLLSPDGSNSIISLREASDLFGFDIVNEGTVNHLFINGFENTATARTDLCISRANGNVGIGTNTTSTTFKLLVNGLTSSQNLTLTGTNGALHWGTFNSATLIGRAGANNIFSTGSLIDDIVIKSGTNRVHLQSGNTTPALTILTDNNVNIRNALLVGTITSSAGFIASFNGSVSLTQQNNSTLRFGDAGGISWNTGTGALYRAGTNGEISTSAVAGDIILRSDPTTRLLLQSGDANAGIIIDTNNSVFVRNRIRFDGKTTNDVGAQFPCNKLDLLNSSQSMGFGAASNSVLEYYTPKQHYFTTGTNGLIGDYGSARMVIDHDSLSVTIYERLFMGTGRWHGSAIDFKERFYFDSDGTTYIRGHGEETVAFVVQNLYSEAKLIVNHNGVIQQEGTGAGYIARADGFDIRMSCTTNGGNIQIGNANSGRGDYAFIGVTGTASGVTFGGNLLIESGYSRDIIFNTWSSFTPTGTNYQWLFGNTTGNTRRANALATWDTTSDHRLKENIIKANLNTCYDNIKNLNLYKYNYIDTYKSGADTNRLGFIAQDVKKQFPKSVSKEKVVLNDNREIPDALTINIDQIQMSLYGTVKQLIKIVENQNIRIKKLEDMLNIVDDTIICDDAGVSYCRDNCDGLCDINNILPSPVRECETMKSTQNVKEIVNQNLPNPQKYKDV